MGVLDKTAAQPIGVCVILQDEEGRVLLGKRKNAFKSGYYGLPGGRIEVGEKLEVAAQREILEETGVDVLDLEYVGVVKDFQGDKDFIHFIYSCCNWRGTLQNKEPEKCAGWEWFNVANLPEPIVEGHLAGIEMLRNQVTVAEIRSKVL